MSDEFTHYVKRSRTASFGSKCERLLTEVTAECLELRHDVEALTAEARQLRQRLVQVGFTADDDKVPPLPQPGADSDNPLARASTERFQLRRQQRALQEEISRLNKRLQQQLPRFGQQQCDLDRSHPIGLRTQLEAANSRIRDLDRALEHVKGAHSGLLNDHTNLKQLLAEDQAQLACANNRIAILQHEVTEARAQLQQRPAIQAPVQIEELVRQFGSMIRRH